VRATSRTFIRSKLPTTRTWRATDYGSKLDSLPEELRRVYRDGDFTVGMKDDDFQVIPTAWIEAAMQRWTPSRRAYRHDRDGGRRRAWWRRPARDRLPLRRLVRPARCQEGGRQDRPQDRGRRW
jgi:hypothetical protein